MWGLDSLFGNGLGFADSPGLQTPGWVDAPRERGWTLRGVEMLGDWCNALGSAMHLAGWEI